MTNDKLTNEFDVISEDEIGSLRIGESTEVRVKYPGEWIGDVERVEGGYSAVYRGTIIMVYTVDEAHQIITDLMEKERYRRSQIVAAQERGQYLNISSGIVTFNLTTPTENYASFRRTFLGMELMMAALRNLLSYDCWVLETPWGMLITCEDQLDAIDWERF